ncbi:helix-turn-helix domain-containing protein [Phaeobacter sp. C3_T13_0]|uniref:helix-turn-helix domain-containing protein n=1 Tax=Phaeobacter cretensis TaxID=3342641 RepID=UPI0039BC669F
MRLYDIGEVATKSGVTPATLRYYEDIGLITSLSRKGLRRQFGPETLLQLSLIALGKAAGFTLAEITGMFGSDGQPDLPRADLHKRADQLDKQIKNLSTLRDAMRHVANCPAPSHMECPTFQRLLNAVQRTRVAAGTG